MRDPRRARLPGLLWPLWRSIANAPRARGGRTRSRILLFGTLGVAFMLASFFGARWLFEAFLQAEFLAELLIRRTVGIVLLFFTGLLVFSSTVTAFSTLFAADDLPLLVVAPVSTGRLYLARLAETWLQSSWMMLVFALPMMAACGPVLAAPWWYYRGAARPAGALTLICAAAGTIVALLLARVFPRGGCRRRSSSWRSWASSGSTWPSGWPSPSASWIPTASAT
ncbi:MAG: hypothetical protein R3F43_03725 [bacterium]